MLKFYKSSLEREKEDPASWFCECWFCELSDDGVEKIWLHNRALGDNKYVLSRVTLKESDFPKLLLNPITPFSLDWPDIGMELVKGLDPAVLRQFFTKFRVLEYSTELPACEYEENRPAAVVDLSSMSYAEAKSYIASYYSTWKYVMESTYGGRNPDLKEIIKATLLCAKEKGTYDLEAL